MTLTENLVDHVSMLIDEVSLRLLALRKGRMLFSRTIRPGEDIVETLRFVCTDKLCLARVDSEELEGTLLVWKGVIAASYSRVRGFESSGTRSLRAVVEAANRGVRLTVFEIPQDEFAGAYGDVVRLLEGARQRVPAETPSVGAPPKKEQEDLASSVARLAKSLDLPVVSASALAEGGRVYAKFTLAREVRYPLSLALLVIRELVARGLRVDEVDVEAELEGTRPEIEERRVKLRVEVRDPIIRRILAAIAELSVERGFYVEKLEYKVKRGLWRGEHLQVELSVVYPWSRIAALSPDSYRRIPEELARETQRRIYEMWRGKAEVLVYAILQTPRGPLRYEWRAAP